MCDVLIWLAVNAATAARRVGWLDNRYRLTLNLCNHYWKAAGQQALPLCQVAEVWPSRQPLDKQKRDNTFTSYRHRRLIRRRWVRYSMEQVNSGLWTAMQVPIVYLIEYRQISGLVLRVGGLSHNQ